VSHNTLGRSHQVLGLCKKYAEIRGISLFDRASSYTNSVNLSIDLESDTTGIDAVECLLVSSDQLNLCAALRYTGSE
jgi:hypothetical protein